MAEDFCRRGGGVGGQGGAAPDNHFGQNTVVPGDVLLKCFVICLFNSEQERWCLPSEGKCVCVCVCVVGVWGGGLRWGCLL